MKDWLCAFLAFCLVIGWQFATTNANYGGNWTALFCTGAKRTQPPIITEEKIYVFPKSTGYDGQFYHLIAHDPFLRSTLKRYVDNPRLRYQRILVPLAAYTLVLSNAQWIDEAYGLLCLLSIAFGVYWCCRIACLNRLAPQWGLLFLLVPAVPITADRLVLDATLAALTVGFLYYVSSTSPGPSPKLFAVLSCAALTRETGILLVLAFCAHLLRQRKLRLAGFYLFSLAPTACWYFYVAAQTAPNAGAITFIPFAPIFLAFTHPMLYPANVPFPQIVYAADYLALAGMLTAFALVVLWISRNPGDPVALTAAAFVVLGLLLPYPQTWRSVYHYGRIYTPILICLGARAAQTKNPWLLAPAAMMIPRIALQLAPQLIGIAT